MTTIVGIDPGTKRSAMARLHMEGSSLVFLDLYWDDNDVILHHLRWGACDVLSFEWVQNYGRVVGEEVLRTAYWCGQFACVASDCNANISEATRPQIVRHFTGQNNVQKANVRQAILDRFGGSCAKKKGSILHGISNHKWDALAVAMFYVEENNVCKPESWSKGRNPC